MKKTKEKQSRLTIFFDVDDTLYDMTTPFARAFKELFHGRYPELDWRPVYVASRKRSDEVFEDSQKGIITMEDMYVYRWSKAMLDFGVSISREDALTFQKIYQGYQKQICMSDTIKELLTVCVEKGVPIGVITNGPSAHQWNKTKALGISRWISDEHVLVSGDVDVMKPDPEIFRIAEKKINGKDSDVLCTVNSSKSYLDSGDGNSFGEFWFVGDTFETDIVGAMAAGWKTIWFNRRNHPMPEQNPDKIVTSEEELAKEIKKLIN